MSVQLLRLPMYQFLNTSPFLTNTTATLVRCWCLTYPIKIRFIVLWLWLYCYGKISYIIEPNRVLTVTTHNSHNRSMQHQARRIWLQLVPQRWQHQVGWRCRMDTSMSSQFKVRRQHLLFAVRNRCGHNFQAISLSTARCSAPQT